MRSAPQLVPGGVALRAMTEGHASANEAANLARNDPHPPMARDHRGWHVAPAPDGRGAPEQPQGPPPHRTRGFLWFVLALLVLNWASYLFFQPATGQQRVAV